MVSIIAGVVIGPLLMKQGSRGFASWTEIYEDYTVSREVAIGTIPYVDVRDLATAIVTSILTPGLDKMRFIVATDSISPLFITNVLGNHLNHNGYRIYAHEMGCCTRKYAQDVSGVDVNREIRFDRATAQMLINFKPAISMEQSVIDTSDSMMNVGYIADFRLVRPFNVFRP